jgi:PBP4 family serine-type D-alanyl-D-alanine carboxypeptidase
VVPRLVLIGTGDPSLRSADLVDMALELRALGVRKVTELAVDQSAFDDVHVPPAFEQQPGEWAPFRAPVSAVAVDGNTLTLRVVPGKAGELALVEASPPGAVIVRAAVRTVAKAKAEKLELSLSGKGTQIEARVSGTVPAGERHTLLVRRLDDPSLAAGLALKKALVDVGVAVGEVKLGARASEKALVTRSSRPLAELVTRLGKESDNFYAEQIFKALGAAKREPATASRAAARVEALLREVGALDAGTKVRNGSGLFDASRATAAGMTELLRVAALDARVGPELMGSLAIGGRRRHAEGQARRAARAQGRARQDRHARGGRGALRLRAGPARPRAARLLVLGVGRQGPPRRREEGHGRFAGRHHRSALGLQQIGSQQVGGPPRRADGAGPPPWPPTSPDSAVAGAQGRASRRPLASAWPARPRGRARVSRSRKREARRALGGTPGRVSRGARSEVAHLLADLAERLLLELANALAREVVLVADLLERELVLVVEAEAPPDDARLDGRQRR